MPIFLSVNRRLNMMFSYFEVCALISGDSFKRLATDKQNQSKFFKSVVFRAGFHICWIWAFLNNYFFTEKNWPSDVTARRQADTVPRDLPLTSASTQHCTALWPWQRQQSVECSGDLKWVTTVLQVVGRNQSSSPQIYTRSQAAVVAAGGWGRGEGRWSAAHP